VTFKKLSNVVIKDESLGEIEAVFSRLVDSAASAKLADIDSDGDITFKGAFTNGAHVVMSAYGHKSWEGALPYGVGTIEEIGDVAVFKGRFAMNTDQGRNAFEVIKMISAVDLQEWSYSLHDVVAEVVTVEGRKVRALKKISVKEVSPVLKGAGNDTMTLSVKSSKMKQLAGEVWGMLHDAGRARWNANGTYAYLSDFDIDLGFAVFDIWGDGQTNQLQVDYVRTDTGVTLGVDEISVVATTVFVPKSADMKFGEHLAAVVAAVTPLVERAESVLALRSEKGKGLAPESAEQIRAVSALIKRLTPNEAPAVDAADAAPGNDASRKAEGVSALLAAALFLQGMEP
jgi:hypothetical protein